MMTWLPFFLFIFGEVFSSFPGDEVVYMGSLAVGAFFPELET